MMKNSTQILMDIFVSIKKASIWMLLPILLVSLTEESTAQDKVLNIYFCGTGLDEEGLLWDGQEPWAYSTNPKELISSLYENDASQEIIKSEILGGLVSKLETHRDQPNYKYIANGIGSDGISILGQVDPDFGLRGWNAVVSEGELALNLISEINPKNKVVLNLIGFSRGGILCMKMAKKIATNVKVSKINILAFDPVPGGFDPIGNHNIDFQLSAKVNQFIGVYAQNESSYMFEPVIPYINNLLDNSKVWLVSVPGSHETMVGNCENDGHSTLSIDNTYIAGMRYVYNVSTVIAHQLLTSNEWGKTVLKTSPADTTQVKFNDLVEKMNTCGYSKVQSTSFGTGWSRYDPCFAGVSGRDYDLRIVGLPHMTSRLCFISNFRHETEFAWTSSCWIWPVYTLFINAEQVYWLHEKVSAMDENSWSILQSLRGNSPVDNDPPVAIIDTLPILFGECSVIITVPPTANDAVSGMIIGTTNDPLEYLEQGNYTINWEYDDGNGNVLTQNQTVIVKDTTPPTPNEEQLLSVIGECSATITDVPMATDNCTGEILGTTNNSLEYTEQGTYTVTWTYDDGNGNIATQEQTVIVEDVTPPVIEELLAYTFTIYPSNYKSEDVPQWPINFMRDKVYERPRRFNREDIALEKHQRKYETITINELVKSVSDNCSNLTIDDVIIAKVTCDEPEDSQWTVHIGNKEEYDIIISDDCKSVDLKREFDFRGNGRVYTVHLSLQDEVGNEAMETCQFGVLFTAPAKLAIADTPVYEIYSDCYMGDDNSPNVAKSASSEPILTAEMKSDQEGLMPENGFIKNYPNPFNSNTTFTFGVTEISDVTLSIYNMQGQLVRILYSGEIVPGSHNVDWNGTNEQGVRVASGIYIYRLFANNEVVATGKAVLRK